MADPDLRTLADTAGIIVDWTDAGGVAQRVGDDTLVAVLDALGIHARTPAQCREAQAELNARSTQAPPLIPREVFFGNPDRSSVTISRWRKPASLRSCRSSSAI